MNSETEDSASMEVDSSDTDTDSSAAPVILESVNKKVQVRSKGRVMGIVRENYLRTDIPCRSEVCFEGCDNRIDSKGKRTCLPEDVTHYIIPFTDVTNKYMEILEFSDITGVIFPQTVVNSVQSNSLRHYRRILNFIRDPKNKSIFFPNEFFKSTYVHRETSEQIKNWQNRMIYQTGVWFYEHLGGQKPVILISEDDSIVKAFSSLRIEVFVMSLKQYLADFWGHLSTAAEVYTSIQSSSVGDEEDRDSKDFVDYYKAEILESGIKTGKFFSGRLDVNKHYSAVEAFVSRGATNESSSDKGGGDVLIYGRVSRNRAVNGDIVVVQLLPKSEWRGRCNALTEGEDSKQEEAGWSKGADVMPTGRVVGVLSRGWRDYIATLPREDEDSMDRAAGKRVLVYPFDRRIPRIRILTSQSRALQGHRVVVRIDAWPVNSQYPQGHFVKSLGRVGDLETEMDTILAENSIEVTPFSQGILSELPDKDAAKNWMPEADQLEKRRDLREQLVMSIDPRGCEDVDDTLSVRRLDNGNIELGVHIADVTQFVKFNSLTDLEARKRATTVYMADRRYDMLPEVLSANLCSLLGGVERYAVSVIWELHPKSYKVKDVWYGRTIVRSSYKLCYEHAQDILDGKTAAEMKELIPEFSHLEGPELQSNFDKVSKALILLSKVARKVQTNREKEGALNLESTEVQFEFEASSLTNIKPKEHLAVHETVAECMIMANHWVAKKISEIFPSNALLRLHPPPKKENFEELQKCAASKGWSVEIWSNKVLSESLDRCNDHSDSNVNFLLRSLATYAMVQALYFSTGSVSTEEWSHYGLALERYTHFTSPIRRYADIIVHRLLLAAVEKSDWWSGGSMSSPNHLLDNTPLQELCQHINTRNRAAQRAQRSSQELFQTLYFKDRPLSDPRCVVDAVVFSLRTNGFLVYIPSYALKGPVYVENKQKEVLRVGKLGASWQSGVVWQDKHAIRVETVEGTQTYRIFDHVTVGIQLKGSEAHGHSLSFSLLDNKPFREGCPTSQEGNVNFLAAARKEQKENEEEEEEECSVDGNEMQSKRKKKKINPFQFFQSMRLLGMSTINDNKE